MSAASRRKLSVWLALALGVGTLALSSPALAAHGGGDGHQGNSGGNGGNSGPGYPFKDR